jgi:hypothetical protein
VTGYDSIGELQSAFRQHLHEIQDDLDAVLGREEFLLGSDRRRPLIDLRFTGTLQFDRGSFRVDELADETEQMFDALYVQTNTSRVTTADIQELLDELEDDEVFVDGRLQTDALEQRVFETIAKESEFSDQADAVADLLGEAHRMAQGGESADDITDIITESRRELFPEATSDVVLEVEEDPFADPEVGDESPGGSSRCRSRISSPTGTGRPSRCRTALRPSSAITARASRRSRRRSVSPSSIRSRGR